MHKKIEKLTSAEVQNIIDELTANVLDSMKIPGCDRNTGIETYHVGEDGDFICMISFRDKVVGSVLIYRNMVISTTYNSGDETDVIN